MQNEFCGFVFLKKKIQKENPKRKEKPFGFSTDCQKSSCMNIEALSVTFGDTSP